MTASSHASELPPRAVGPVVSHPAERRAAADPVGRLLDGGRRLALVSGGILLVVHLLNAVTVDSDMFNANVEDNVWTWCSVVATFAVALAAVLGASAGDTGRRRFLALAPLAAFLSLDDAVMVHERMTTRVLQAFDLSQELDSVVWPVLYLPLMAVTALLLWRLTRHRPATRHLMTIALVLFAAAVALEMGSAPWSLGDDNPVAVIEGGFEEAFELAAWVLAATAVLASGLGSLLAAGRRAPG